MIRTTALGLALGFAVALTGTAQAQIEAGKALGHDYNFWATMGWQQHAQSHAVELEAAQREAAAAQAQATTAKGRNVLLEKAWTAALEVSRGCSDHNLLGKDCLG